MVIERKAKLRLLNNSVLHVMPGAVLTLERGARLDVTPGSRIILHGDAVLKAKACTLRKLQKQDRLVQLP
jgi:hypothetical protein